MVVVENAVDDGEAPNELKDLVDVLDRKPAFTEEMLRLTRWISQYYVCSWGEVIKAALPSGIEHEGIRKIYPTGRRPDLPEGSELEQQVIAALHKDGGATVTALQDRFSSSVTLAMLRRLEDEGRLRIEQDVEGPEVEAKTQLHVRFSETIRTDDDALDTLIEELPGHKQKEVVRTLEEYIEQGTSAPSQADLLAAAEASHSTIKSLERRGLIERFEREVLRTPLGDRPADPDPPDDVTLMAAQREAVDTIVTSLDDSSGQTFLLHGITGSGKTEVYIRVLKRIVARGQSAIVLVPEIALTPQTVNRFRAHFPEEVGVLHSRMSAGERYDTWRQVRNGNYRIVIGPRSAVFAPVQDLGLVVVDEEHEGSYKQFDPAPRYHARDVAVMRAHMNDAACILGSATPSLESYLNAKHDKYQLLELPERVAVGAGDQAVLPDVQIVDLTLERRKHRLEGSLSEALREAIEQRLEREEQVMLLQNRRGYAPVMECKDCGWSPGCSDCAVSLTYHKARRQLRCHYCGVSRRAPSSCPSCDSSNLDLLGEGTQRIEEEIDALFPGARVQRMDRDTTSRKHAHRKILDRFSRGTIDILLGTQMIAKGLDFERVTLVGVVNADTGMLFPDFRSEERTFQLLTQVAGRAGRSHLPGEVILQTRNPEHRAILCARTHDYETFVEAELAERRQFGYPPYGRLVGIEFRGSREKHVKQAASTWTSILRKKCSDGQVLGPEEAFVRRVKRQYRYQTLLRTSRRVSARAIQQWLRSTQEAFGTASGDCRVVIDVDPVGRF
jgi:primosomal protein N' (replication factor Y)